MRFTSAEELRAFLDVYAPNEGYYVSSIRSRKDAQGNLKSISLACDRYSTRIPRGTRRSTSSKGCGCPFRAVFERLPETSSPLQAHGATSDLASADTEHHFELRTTVPYHNHEPEVYKGVFAKLRRRTSEEKEEIRTLYRSGLHSARMILDVLHEKYPQSLITPKDVRNTIVRQREAEIRLERLLLQDWSVI